MTENTAPTSAELRARINSADIYVLNYVLGWLTADPEPFVRAAVAEALDAAEARTPLATSV